MNAASWTDQSKNRFLLRPPLQHGRDTKSIEAVKFTKGRGRHSDVSFSVLLIFPVSIPLQAFVTALAQSRARHLIWHSSASKLRYFWPVCSHLEGRARSLRRRRPLPELQGASYSQRRLLHATGRRTLGRASSNRLFQFDGVVVAVEHLARSLDSFDLV
jgi:hypothetical protein